MKPFYRKAVKDFKNQADGNFLKFSDVIAAAMGKNATTFTDPTPPIADLLAANKDFGNKITDAANRDKVAVGLKNTAKKVVIALLNQLCDYVNMVAQGDENILLLSSFNLNKIPEPVKMKRPTGLVLGDGENAGEITYKFKGPYGAVGYIYEYSTDPTLAESSWQGEPGSSTFFLLTGTKKEVTYFCRVVAIGTKGQRTVSNVVSRVSQ